MLFLQRHRNLRVAKFVSLKLYERFFAMKLNSFLRLRMLDQPFSMNFDQESGTFEAILHSVHVVHADLEIISTIEGFITKSIR